MGTDCTRPTINVERMQLGVIGQRPALSQQEREAGRRRIAAQLFKIFQKYSGR